MTQTADPLTPSLDPARLGRAVTLAAEAHAGQLRTGTRIPYLAHVLGVASIALEHGADEEQCIAALLHDAIEDGGQTYVPLILEAFGPRVLRLVEACTDGVPGEDGNKEDWWLRKRRYLAHLQEAPDDVLLVSGADKLHNARAILADLRAEGAAVFERFKAGRAMRERSDAQGDPHNAPPPTGSHPSNTASSTTRKPPVMHEPDQGRSKITGGRQR
jgi:GTP pyrophosphokinase